MQLNLTELTEKGKRLDFDYQPEDLPLDEDTRLTEPLEVSLRGRLDERQGGRDVEIEGKYKGHAEVRCDRCLKTFSIPLDAEFSVRYIPATDYEAREQAELEEKDLEFSVFAGESINVDELIREQVLLQLPSRLLCSEECKGLCPHCGADLNEKECGCEQQSIDPRWEALALLKENE